MFFLDQIHIPENNFSVTISDIVSVAVVVIVLVTAAVFLIDHFTNKKNK